MADSISKDMCVQGSEEYIDITCKACEDDGKYKAASGWCRECEEYMCLVCFGHHRKGKLCKYHVLLDLSEKKANRTSASDERLEKCKQHLSGAIKFYCQSHDQVGCGDCMILEHKLCKIDYIPGIARDLDSYCDDLASNFDAINRFIYQISGCLTEIRNKRTKLREELARVKADAEAFREGIVKRINELTEELCERADNLQTESIRNMDKLEKEASEVEQELMATTYKLETLKEHNNQLFVATKQVKQTLKDMERQMDSIKNKILEQYSYSFQRNAGIESIVTDNDSVLGFIQTTYIDGDNADVRHGDDNGESDINTKDAKNTESLHSRSLRIDNLEVNGEYLSYTDNRKYKIKLINNGLFIGDTGMDQGSYFEIEIIKSGESRGSIGIGLVPADYPKSSFPGWRKGSIGYHSDDGRMFSQSFTGKRFGPACNEGDKMGCGVSPTNPSLVFFTRNGLKIGDVPFTSSKRVFPAVALDTFGQKVKISLEANKGRGTSVGNQSET